MGKQPRFYFKKGCYPLLSLTLKIPSGLKLKSEGYGKTTPANSVFLFTEALWDN